MTETGVGNLPEILLACTKQPHSTTFVALLRFTYLQSQPDFLGLGSKLLIQFPWTLSSRLAVADTLEHFFQAVVCSARGKL